MGGFPFRERSSGVSNRYNLDYPKREAAAAAVAVASSSRRTRLTKLHLCLVRGHMVPTRASAGPNNEVVRLEAKLSVEDQGPNGSPIVRDMGPTGAGGGGGGGGSGRPFAVRRSPLGSSRVLAASSQRSGAA
jgi:hypothetical protein